MMPYILHAALLLAGCLAFYKILLHKETFYRINRLVLLACLVLSFTLPLLPVPEQWSFRSAEPAPMDMPMVFPEVLPGHNSTPPAEQQQPAAAPTVSAGPDAPSLAQQSLRWIGYLYWFGVAAFGLNLLIQLVTLLYRAYSRPVIRDGRYRIVELSGDQAPCSFGNNIFINPEKYDWDTYCQILEHEKIHVQQGHSYDIFLAELVLVFQWFNPFAWLYRRELESNLEFLTDDQLLQDQRVERTAYQMNLLKVAAPHLPLSLTTNYNQSLLKKRIVMMNGKRSNLHTAWKYFFLLPLMVLFLALFNKPVAFGRDGQGTKAATQKTFMETEGSWFATIKGEKVSIQFKSDEDEGNSFNSSTFLLSELPNLPRGSQGSFNLVREAGTMAFTGKFEGDQGMGRYQFTGDKTYASFMKQQGIEDLDDRELLPFFFIDIKKSYVQMLQGAGYKQLGKDQLIPLAALKVDAAYINALKESGLTDLSPEDLIPLKSLNVDGAYIKEIRDAGYKNVSAHQLVSLKAQGIDGKYIRDVKAAEAKSGTGNANGNANEDDDDGDDSDPGSLVAYKAMNIDPAYIESLRKAGYNNLSRSNLVAAKAQNITAEYIQSFQAAGYENIPMSQLISFKALGVTPAFIKSFEEAGYKNISPSTLTGLKAQDITVDFIRSYEALGYKNVPLSDFTALKAMNVTPEYIRSFSAVGFNNPPLSQVIALKAHHITPAQVKEYRDLGFTDLDMSDVIAAKATGVTPAFISEMKSKGHNLKSV
ncbi:MAG TPA: M56 family metallopeptidase, partial [Chitinophagaceae bacterium]|nr:M56 family metallopeptidase [Chitinophagaceae bacterium]